MERYSVLMLVSRYHEVSGHTRVIDSLSKELVNLGHKVTIGSFNFEDVVEDLNKVLLVLKIQKINLVGLSMVARIA